MNLQEKQKKIEELRLAYKNAKTETDRKIISVRGKLLKMSITTLV